MATGHDHDHGTSTASASALTRALLLTAGFLIVEIIAGILTNSLALLSDAAHMLTDTAGIAIALAAIKIGERPADNRRTFGYRRFEILAAALNSILLFLAAAYILYEAWRRLIAPSEIHTLPMLAVAFVGLLVNLAAMRILAPGKDASLNGKGAYLEVWSDMLGSVGVMLAAVVIYLTGWSWVDPLVAVGIGLWVLPRTWQLFSATMNVLLEGVPDGIDPDAVANELKSTPGVADIHDLHIWALTSNQPSLSVHLVLHAGADADAARRAAAERLAHRFHIEHATIQTEKTDCRDTGHGRTHGIH